MRPPAGALAAASERGHGGVVTDVSGNGQGGSARLLDLGHGRLRQDRIDVVQHHRGSRRRQPSAGSPADAGGSPGDHGHLPVQES